MKLLTKEILKKLPALRATENVAIGDKVAVVKFFSPWTSWTWYGIEYDPVERLFFGFVDGFDKEFGYFSLTELEEVHGPCGLKVERDMFFDSVNIKVACGESGHRLLDKKCIWCGEVAA